MQTARLGLAGTFCITALLGCGSSSTSTTSCSSVSVIDRTTTGVLWTKRSNASRVRVGITGDDSLVVLRERQSSDEQTQLVDATTGKVRHKVDGDIGDVGLHTVDIGRRLYSSVNNDMPNRQVWNRSHLSNDRWLTTLIPGDGATPATFVIEDSTGNAEVGTFRGYAVTADNRGVIASWNGELIEYGIEFLEFGSEAGGVRWKYSPPTPVDSFPATLLGTNYLALPAKDDASNSVVINRTSGEADTVEGQIVDLEGIRAVVRKSGTMRRVNLETGAVEWTLDGLEVLDTHRIAGVLVGKIRENGALIAINVLNGSVAWRKPAQTAQADALIFAIGTAEVLTLTEDLKITKLRTLDATTGSATWEVKLLALTRADVSVGTNRMVVTGNCVK
jgi:outer membrane protein assembly factor BamB